MCGRQFLLETFANVDGKPSDLSVNKVDSCDVCAGDIPENQPAVFTGHVSDEDDDDSDGSLDMEVDVQVVTPDQRQKLRQQLKYLQRSNLRPTFDSQGQLLPLYCGADLTCGLSDELIGSIVSACERIYSIDDPEESCLVWGQAHEIMSILSTVLDV